MERKIPVNSVAKKLLKPRQILKAQAKFIARTEFNTSNSRTTLGMRINSNKTIEQDSSSISTQRTQPFTVAFTPT